MIQPIQLDPSYQSSPDLLKGRSILITGAGDGIGKELAITAARHGAEVVLLGRTQAKLEAVYDEIEKITGNKSIICPVELETMDEAQADQLADSLAAELGGKLDGLVHNAGILGQRAPVQNHSVAVWQSVMQINLNACFILSKALLPLLTASPDGRILFTTSGVGRIGIAFWGAYGVSKFAVEGLSQTLADELTQTTSIRVNAVNPGITRTAMRAAAAPAENPASIKPPSDLMYGYLYLLGPDSKDVSGQSIDL
jgi:NAD(P)-dependent dehydrogenase (short-subunit alcohol dehydrogenase family)